MGSQRSLRLGENFASNSKETWAKTEQHSSHLRNCGVFLRHHQLNQSKVLWIPLSRKDLIAAELETVTVSRNPTKVITANGAVQTNEEATVYVKDLGLFVTVQLLEDTPPVLSLGQLCEDHEYSYEWTGG